MKKNYKVSLVATIFCSCALMSSTAFAENYSFPGLAGFYGVATVGGAKYDVDTSEFTSNDDTDTAFSLGIGYEFNPYIAIEAGYQDLGETSVGTSGTMSGTLYGQPYTLTGTLTATAEVDGFYLGPQLSYPFTDQFKVYAKGGVYFWDVDADATASGSLTYGGTSYSGSATASDSDDGNDLYYGLGASFDFTELFAVKADWTRYDIDDDNVDVFAAGIVFRFGKLFNQ